MNRVFINLFSIFFIKVAVVSILFTTSSFASLNYKNNVDVLRAINVYEAPTTDKFAQFLAIGYKSYSLYKLDILGDLNSANYYARKAMDAYSGQRVLPEILANAPMPAFAMVDLDKGHDDLLYILRKDLIELYPFLVADAQTKYDCWFDQTLKGMGKKYWQPCKEKFQKTLRLIYQKIDEDCIKCKLELAEAKRKAKQKSIAKKEGLDDFNLRLPRIPRWNPDNLLKVEVAPKYAVDLPDVLVNSNDKIYKEVAELKNMISDLGSKVAGLNAEVQNNIASVKVDVEGLDKSVADINHTLSELQGSIQNAKDTCTENCKKNFTAIKEIKEQLNNLIPSIDKLATAKPVYKTPEVKIVKVEDTDLKKVQEDMQSIKEALNKKAEDRHMFVKKVSTTTTTNLKKKDTDNILRENIGDETDIDEIELPLEIFFDWGSYEIDKRFDVALQQIAEMMNDDKTFSLVIEGHTDTSGPAAFNMDLSKRRASNVMKSILSFYDIDENRFIIIPKGQTDLKVKTVDGVKEPENRRARIIKVTK